MKQPSKNNFLNQIINSKYQIIKKIKVGGFGSVYSAKNITQSFNQYAVKLMPLQTKKYANVQLNMYQLIEKQKFTNGFIKYYEHGQFINHFYLIMQLIGSDLEDIKKIMTVQKFSLKTVLMIGLQSIDRLEALHKIGYIHRDVKPDNLAIGLREKSKIIYLFDFGLALKIGSQVPKDEKGKVVGTLGYMSCRGHEGKQQGPSDDIQSLMYTLIYLLQGSLPWQKLQIKSPADFHKILLSKKGLAYKAANNKSNSRVFIQILCAMQKNKWTDKVDYLQIKYKLLDTLKSIKQQNDFMFDWLSPTHRKKQQLSPLRKKKELSPQQQLKNRKKLQYMNQQNQQLVQNEIYQVFKFIQHTQEGKEKEKRKRSKSKSPDRNKINHKAVQVPQPQKKAMRPMSAATKPKNQLKNTPQWQKIIAFQTTNMVSGPKIVINKTAKHKI